MQGKIINNWNKFDYSNPDHKAFLLQALRYRMALQDKFPAAEFTDPDAPNYSPQLAAAFKKANGEIRAAYQAFTTTGDFPPAALEVIEKYHALNNYDQGYEMIFDVKDFTGSKREGFRMVNVESGLTFEKIPIGDKIKLKQMSGTQEFVFFDYYGGGLNWHRSLFENQDFWTIEDNAMEFINKAYHQRASVHYQLLEAALDQKTCITLEDPGCNDCTEYARAIAKALNAAAVTIMTAVQNKGYGITAGTVLYILVPFQLMSAVKEALAVRLQAFDSSVNITNFNFQPIYTMMLADTTRLGLFLSKLKIKSGYRMNLTTFGSFDMLSYSEATAGWMSFGAAVGDMDQVECIDATAPSGISGA